MLEKEYGMQVAGEWFQLISERLAKMKEAQGRALNPGEMDADHPTSAPRLSWGGTVVATIPWGDFSTQ